MPLPGCLGYDCGGERNCGGRSAWGERILTLDQFAKESQQPKLRADVVPDSNWAFGSPDAHQQLQAFMKEQQAAAQELLSLQAGLLATVQRQHRELCERLERQWPGGGAGLAPAAKGPAVECCGSSSLSAAKVDLTAVEAEDDNPLKFTTSRLKLGKFGNTQSTAGTSFLILEPKLGDHSDRAAVPLEHASGWEYIRLGLTTLVDHSYFDCVMGLVIVLNFVCVFVQFEWKGMDVAYQLSLSETDGGWPDAEKVFQQLEMGFCTLYLLELMARLYVYGRSYLCKFGQLLDTLIVISSCIDVWVLTPLSLDQGTFVLARLVRLVRISRVLRAVKLFRFMSLFRELRAMIRSFVCSSASLLWSMLFIFVVIVAGGLLMVQLCLSFMEDESASLETRRWVFQQFGTALRSTWSMFEATFTTGWPAKARPLVMEVSPWFSIFWVFYTTVVNFAVMKVIAALFLKHTLSVATRDEERMSMEKMAQKEAFAAEIHQIFQRGDKLGDGVLHRWEFEAMMQDSEVLEKFKELDLSQKEIQTLFIIIADSDGVADYEEFLDGALKMKSSAQRLDMIEVLHEQLLLRRQMAKMQHDYKQFLRATLAGRVPAGSSSGAAGNAATTITAGGPESLQPRGNLQEWDYRDGEVAVEEDIARMLGATRRSSFKGGQGRSSSSASLVGAVG